MKLLLKKSVLFSQAHFISRALSTSSGLGTKEWRLERGLCANRTAEGVLTDTPDFTYLDGRPTPLLQKQKKRMLRNREFASKIVEMVSELEFAKERYKNMEKAKEQERQNVIENRLKPKGAALYQKKEPADCTDFTDRMRKYLAGDTV